MLCHKKRLFTCHASLPLSIRMGYSEQPVALDASLRSA
jgi:hypothetical protein